MRATRRPRWEFLFVPAVWCAITGATLWAMEAPDAWVTPTSALLAFVVASRMSLGARRAHS